MTTESSAPEPPRLTHKERIDQCVAGVQHYEREVARLDKLKKEAIKSRESFRQQLNHLLKPKA